MRKIELLATGLLLVWVLINGYNATWTNIDQKEVVLPATTLPPALDKRRKSN